MSKLIMFFSLLVSWVAVAAVPTQAEFTAAGNVIADLLEPQMAAMKSGKKKPAEVADYAVSLIGESETAAAKFLLARRAYGLYMKGGAYDKAAEAIGEMRAAVPDMPNERMLKAVQPDARNVSAKKAPAVYTIVADLKAKVFSQNEIEKLEAALEKAKASERESIHRQLGERYAVMGDWEKALEHFAKSGGDAAPMAADETSGDADANKLAGFWWDYSENPTVKKSVATAVRQHAIAIYQKGLDDGTISGLNKKLAEQRINEAVMDSHPEAAKISAVKSESGQELYCVVDLSKGPDAKEYPVSYLKSAPFGGWGRVYKTTKLVLRRIEPGEVKVQGKWNAKITRPYYIGVFEVTRKQWELVKGPCREKEEDTLPMSRCSYDIIRWGDWPDTMTPRADGSFMRRLQEKTGLDFDLPTEAQWEMACRAGSKDNKPKDPIVKVARVKENGGKLEKVGSYKPNAWGLYDMLGNAIEWCIDREYWNRHSDNAVNPVGSREPAHKARNAFVKGASFKQTAEQVSFGYGFGWGRGNWAEDVGFRVCLNIVPWDGWQNPQQDKK